MGIWLEHKPVVHTEHTIQRLLVHRYYSGCKYLIPNLYYQLGEADLLIIRRSEYSEEFEIKITTSDLRADLRKVRKHQYLLMRFNSNHARQYMVPNKLSYVLSKDVKYEDFNFPPYAGIYIANRGLRCIRDPKFIHKEKYKWDIRIATSCSFRLLKALKLSTAYEQPD